MDKNQITSLLKRTEGGKNYMTSLLTEYGYTKTHPRTKEQIISITSDIRNKAQLPQVAHNRHMNQTVKSGGYKIDIETKEIYGWAKYKQTAQWESVWYQKGQRRK